MIAASWSAARLRNIASRVQNLATSSSIYVTGPVIGHPNSSRALDSAGLKSFAQDVALRGITERVAVDEIP